MDDEYEREVPTSEEHDRTCMYYRSFGAWPCDCTDTAEALDE